MKTEPVRQEIGDLCAARARAALERITAGSKRTREDWREYGQQLRVKRAETPSAKEFGRWVTENGLDAPPANTPGARSDAIWLAENWTNVEKFYFTADCKVDDHHPTNLRTGCRRAGFDWAGKRVEPIQRETAGWTEAAEYYLGVMPAGFSRNTLAQTKSKKAEIEAELGEKIPQRVRLDSDWPKKIGEAITHCFARKEPAKAADRIEQEWSAVQAEAKTLPETARAKFDRICEKAQQVLQDRFMQEVDAKVAPRLESQREYYRSLAEEARTEVTRYTAMRKTLDQWMTKDEYRLVLGCLHPDRQHPDQRARYDRAFQIFKRLEERLEPDGRMRSGRGW